MNFREDINGIRAIAVAAVLLFHFGVPGFAGGFVGVDVFFVISGYLMTRIIFGRIATGRFSLTEFYAARCRRIVPALAAVCLAMLAAGWYVLPPQEYRALGKHVAASAMFLSNVLYWRQNGYFEPSSHENWMLHTWSLAVEWQFYLLYPLLVLGLARFLGPERIRRVLLGLAVLSCAACLVVAARAPDAAFYLLPTRAWEMLAGALAFLFPAKLPEAGRRALEGAGLALIAAGVVLADAQAGWPNVGTLTMPVLGTALVIVAHREKSFATSNPVSRWLGKASYSIYLWHWPLAVALRYFDLPPDPLLSAAGVALSIAVGRASYVLIEKNALAERPASPGARFHLGVSAPLAGSAVLGALVFVLHGLAFRLDRGVVEQMRDIVMPRSDNGWCFYSVDSDERLEVGARGLGCELGDRRAGTTGLLFGDSFAGHYEPFWDEIAKASALRMVSVTTNWCFPALAGEFTGPTSSRAYGQCLVNRAYFGEHVGKYDFVVLAASWDALLVQGKLDAFRAALDLAARSAKLVVLMPTPPAFDVSVRGRYERSLMLGLPFDVGRLSRSADGKSREANRLVEAAARAYPNVLYLDRAALFTVRGRPSDLTDENRPFNLDGRHLSVHGSRKAALQLMASGAYAPLASALADMKAGRVARKAGPLLSVSK